MKNFIITILTAAILFSLFSCAGNSISDFSLSDRVLEEPGSDTETATTEPADPFIEKENETDPMQHYSSTEQNTSVPDKFLKEDASRNKNNISSKTNSTAPSAANPPTAPITLSLDKISSRSASSRLRQSKRLSRQAEPPLPGSAAKRALRP